MATDVERLTLLLEVQGQKFENQLKRQNAIAYRIFKDLESRASGAEAKVTKSFDGMADGIGGSFDKIAKIVASGFALNEIKKLVDTWQEATNKIKAAGVSDAMAGATTNEIADIAARSRSGFAEIADLYARLSRTAKDFGASQGEVAVATETVAKALKVSGASASEVQSTLVQLGQALGSGRLQGDELRSLLENAPVVAGAIAKEFGVAIGELKTLGEEGKLVSDRVFRALVNAQPDIEAAFAKTTATIADSFKLLETAAVKFVGNSQGMSRAAQLASGSIQLLAKNFDLLATGATAVGVILASRMIAAGLAPMVASLGASVTAITATNAGLTALGARAVFAAGATRALTGALALVGGPIGAAIVGTAAAVAYLATTSTTGQEATDRYAKAVMNLKPAADAAKEAISGVDKAIDSATQRMNAASMAKLSTEMDGLRSRTNALSSTLQSYVLQIGKVDAAKFNGEDKKRALDLINKAMNGTAEEAVKAAAELKALGETNPSFANAFNRMAAVAEQLGRLREAFRLANQEFSGIEAKASSAALTRRQRKDQRDLEGAGFKLDLSVPSAQQDPVLEGIRLQAREREAALSDSAKRIKALTKEIYEAGLKAGDGTTMAQAEATAKRIAAIEAAQKGGGAKGPKSTEDKAEDRIKSYTDSLARQNLVLQAEIENFGKSNAQKRAAMELARAGVDLNRLDVKTREEVLGKLTAETQKHEELLVAKQKLVDAQKAVNDANRFFGDTAADALEDLIINGEKAEDVLKNVVKQLAKAALQAALMGKGPLAGLFGSSGGGLNIFSMLGLGGGYNFNGSGAFSFGAGGYNGMGPFLSLSSGGFTGQGGKNEPAGMVHKGEYVFSKKAVQKLGLGNLEALHRGFASGGGVGMTAPSVPSGLGRGGGMKVTVNNTQSDKVEATPQMGPNGDLTLIISAVEAQIANNVLRGQGSLSPALTARQTNQHRRG